MVSQSARKIGFVLFVLLIHLRAIACFAPPRAFERSKPRDSIFTTTHAPKALAPKSFHPSIRRFAISEDVIQPEQLLPPTPPRLVVLLPAYNEEQRIGETLHSYQSYLSGSDPWKEMSEILVVDDGSDDETASFVRRWQDGQDDCSVNVTCISLPQNQGKGAAVSFGIALLNEKYGDDPCLVLIADADGSGDIDCLNNMANALSRLIASSQCSHDDDSFWKTTALINGYRGYTGSSLSRSILRWGFRTTVRLLCGDLRVRDSQCGFKLMTLSAARQLYANLNLQQWSHDVEVLYRAREWNVPIAEEVVPWQDKPGSKLVVSLFGAIQASAVMFSQVLQMRLEYALGRWKLPSKDK